MTIEKNQENAFILKLNKKSSPKDNEEFYLSKCMDCFYDVIDSLASEAKSIKPAKPEFTTDSIRRIIEHNFGLYGLCAQNLGGASVTPDYRILGRTIRETPACLLDDAGTISRLKILAVLDKPELKITSEKYVNSFLVTYKLEHGGERKRRKFIEWLAIAAEHYRSREIFELVVTESTEQVMDRFFKADKDFLRYQKMARNRQITEKQMIRHCWSLIQKKLADNYGFAEGRLWSPNQPIDALLSLLRSQGPLAVSGFFSNTFYSEPATPRQIGGKTVYGWKQGSFSGSTHIQLSHTVALVGASKKGYGKTGQDLVYFVNVSPTPTPYKPTTIREGLKEDFNVYILSYESFCQRLINTDSALALESMEGPGQQAFYYYHPALSPKAELKPRAANQPLPAASRRPVLAPDSPVLSHAPAANETLQQGQATDRQAEEPETGRAGWCKKCTIL
jgi:hypothetical protein